MLQELTENGKFKDYATGRKVNINNPEEKIRQEYEKRLCKEYGYSKKQLSIEVPIQIGSKKYPCDIAIYDSVSKYNIIGIVETKAPNVKEGIKQLESYISATPTCKWGVWTNGESEICAIRNYQTGKIIFDAAISIPRKGERFSKIKMFDDLIPASNLKRTFKIINNALYANTNLARTEKQGAEMVRLIFCKMMDEYNAQNGKQQPQFQIFEEELRNDIKVKKAVRKRINSLWEQAKNNWLGSSIFSTNERIEIDDYSLKLIISKLQSYSLLKTEKDVVGDAFEIFAERQFAGEKGQFFTPRSVVNMIVEMINPSKDEKIIDPACGSGGFLISALNHITKNVVNENHKKQIAEYCLYGIDKELDLAKICKAQMCIIGDGKSNIVKEDSLKDPTEWSAEAQSKLLNSESEGGGERKFFDICITNPPFGANLKIDHNDILKRFELGHKWEKIGKEWVKTHKIKHTAPQILFIELCLEFLKPGGRLGIVLPDGLLGNSSDGYVRQWIRKHAELLAVVDCPVATFMPHTGTKTSVLIMKKRELPIENPPIEKLFFAIAENCGHTMRGKEIDTEDFTQISKNYKTRQKLKQNHLGFQTKYDDVLVPRYYDPRIKKEIQKLQKKGFSMRSIKELEEQGELKLKGVPASAKSEEYDLHGNVRFIRTSDIYGYELYGRTQKKISEETYNKYKNKQDVQVGDIFFVKDGDDKIGETAIILDEIDKKILVQTHFKKIRPLKMDKFLLLGLINKDIVKKQIRQRVFSQSTLSTIGNRIYELQLPMPNSQESCEKIITKIRENVLKRKKCLRELQEDSNI